MTYQLLASKEPTIGARALQWIFAGTASGRFSELLLQADYVLDAPDIMPAGACQQFHDEGELGGIPIAEQQVWHRE